MEDKTYDEMLAQAVELFGPDTHITWCEDGWNIHTLIQEKFDPEDYKGTPAYEMEDSHDYSYGNELDRWAWKNGQSDLSRKELYELVNERFAPPTAEEWRGLDREHDPVSVSGVIFAGTFCTECFHKTTSDGKYHGPDEFHPELTA